MTEASPKAGRSRRRGGSAGPLLTRRALNRALLARQLLLERRPLTAFEAVHHLAGLQSQAPTPPYFALWTRLAGFQPEHLSRLLLDRAVVRLALMRNTIHLVTAADALELRALLQPIFDRELPPATRRQLEGVDRDQLRQAGREVVEARPRTWEELGLALLPRWPDRDPTLLARAVRNLLPLVQVPPRGVWGAGGPAAHTTLDTWTSQALVTAPSAEGMVRRYLAANGPASVRDIQAWTGLTRLGAVFERLRPELLTFVDEAGVELFDLPEAPRPDPATPAPLRFLAEFDSILLSHADRSRIMSEELKRLVFTVNGIVRGTVLVDGFVAGVWKLDQQGAAAILTVESFAPLPEAARAGLEDEGLRLLQFATGPANGTATGTVTGRLDHQVRFQPLA